MDTTIAQAVEQEIAALQGEAFEALKRYLNGRADNDLATIRKNREAIELLEWAKGFEPRKPLPKMPRDLDTPNLGIV